jgi:hypothetical protein
LYQGIKSGLDYFGTFLPNPVTPWLKKGMDIGESGVKYLSNLPHEKLTKL